MTIKMTTMKGTTMRRPLLALLTTPLLLASLSACTSLLPQQPAAPAIYDLGPGGMPISAPVRSADVIAPDWLDSNGMLYRLGDPQRIQRFTEARWASTPAQLLTERLRQRLVLQNTGKALNVGLESFEQRFSSATQSEVVVCVRVSFGERQQVFEVKRAGGADAASGARGLAAATDALIEQMLAWVASIQ